MGERDKAQGMRTIAFAFLVLATGCVKAKPASGPALSRRDLTLTYDVKVSEVPAGSKTLTIWVPLPRDERVQVLQSVSPVVDGGRTRVVTDQAHGNPALEVTISNPSADAEAKVSLGVSRVEEKPGAGGHPLAQPSFAGEDRPDPWLKDDGLTIVDDKIRSIARTLFHDGMSDDAKARAAYDYVLGNMTYKKEGTGWGTGSTAWACDAKYGNCTDFHALFIALCRAGGVPARFRIGFPIPAQAGEGTLAGYHCWAEYHSKARGWIPVDASEAWKHPEKKEYLFGTLDPDRVGISLGRDVAFEGQKGAPLNYFVFPYAEVDGSPVKVTTTVAWSDKR
jgi:transglutaminase-like putative cysteine protease